MKILVFAPHPDDEVLGCGGSIAKHSKKGDEVFLCIATKAYTPDWTKKFIENRKKEIKESNRILGIKKTFFLDFPTVKLDTLPQKEINNAVLQIVGKVEPDIVYVPHKGDLHKDHRLIFEAVLVATRPIGKNIRRVLAYETLSETEWGQSLEPFFPNIYENIEEVFDKKIEAMNAYQSELKQYPHPRSVEGIEILAKKRGLEVGLLFAESFMLLREVSK